MMIIALYFLIQLGAGVDRVISDNMSFGIHLYNNYGTDLMIQPII